MFFSEFCEISKNTFFTEHLWTTASGCFIVIWLTEKEWGEYPKYNNGLEVRSSDKIILTQSEFYGLFLRETSLEI